MAAWVLDWLEDAAWSAGQHVALRDRNTCYTYADLWHSVRAMGSALQESGLPLASRILVFLSNSADFVISCYAAMYAGGTVCPMYDGATAAWFCTLVRTLQPFAIVISDVNYWRLASNDSFLRTIEDVPLRIVRYGEAKSTAIVASAMTMSAMTSSNGRFLPPRQVQGAPAQIVQTTGTTSAPKGVMLSHEQLALAAKNVAQMVHLSPTDIELTALPLDRMFGQLHVYAYTKAKGTLIIEPNLLDPDKTLRKVLDFGATSFPHVIGAFERLMRTERELLCRCDASLRYVMLCSMPSTREQIVELQRCLPTTYIYNTYGLSEAPRSTYVNTTVEPAKILSVGKPAHNVSISIIGDSGQTLPPHRTGQIVISSPHVFLGYWNDAEASARVLRDGRVLTGDLGQMDAEGYLYYEGRADDQINANGRKFLPVEVERELTRSLASISDVAVVGVPCGEAVGGQIITAFVVPTTGCHLSLIDVQKALLNKVEAYKWPQRLQILHSLPRTSSGKVQRKELARRDYFSE